MIAKVPPRGVHNLRRAAVSNLAAADVTMEKITSVTGQTPEVAREHYLTLNSSSQRETMEKLAALYGGAAPIIANDPPQGEVVLRLSPQQAASLAALLMAMTDADAPNSGTNSGTKPEPEAVTAVVSMMERGMAEREGGSKDEPISTVESATYDSWKEARAALKALAALKARILEHVPETLPSKTATDPTAEVTAPTSDPTPSTPPDGKQCGKPEA